MDNQRPSHITLPEDNDPLSFASHNPLTPLPTPTTGRATSAKSGHPKEPVLSLASGPSPHSCRGPIHPGALWIGTQRSGRSCFVVCVRVLSVDFVSGTLTGVLSIRGLTGSNDKIQTFFESEILGDQYGFITNKWGASTRSDVAHWSRFPHFRGLKPHLHLPDLTYRHDDRPFTFMRWKEKFVFPDHKADLVGASYDGFYYICVDWSRPRQRPSLPARKSSSASRASTHPSSIRRPSLGTPPSPSSSTSAATQFRRQSFFSSQTQNNNIPLQSPSSLSTPPPSSSSFHAATPSPPARRLSVPPVSYASVVRRGSSTSSQSSSTSSAAHSQQAPEHSSLTSHMTSSPSQFEASPPGDNTKTEADNSSTAANGDVNGSQTHSSSNVGENGSAIIDDEDENEEFPLPQPARRPSTMARRSSHASSQRSGDGTMKPDDNIKHERDDEGSIGQNLGYKGPWQGATMSGFYFFPSSEPYQELNLTYAGDVVNNDPDEPWDAIVDRLAAKTTNNNNNNTANSTNNLDEAYEGYSSGDFEESELSDMFRVTSVSTPASIVWSTGSNKSSQAHTQLRSATFDFA